MFCSLKDQDVLPISRGGAGQDNRLLQLAGASPLVPVPGHHIPTLTLGSPAHSYGALAILVIPTVGVTTHPPGRATVVTSTSTGLLLVTESSPDTVHHAPALLGLLDIGTLAGLALASISIRLVTVEVLAVCGVAAFPGTEVSLTSTLLVLAFGHIVTVPCLVALPGGRDTETASAETRGRISAARTIGVGVALGAPEEGVAVDDTLAEVTDTGGVGNVLAPGYFLAVCSEATLLATGCGRK